MFTTPIQFYDFFLNRVVVSFKPKFDDPEPRQEFEISLSKKNSYDQVRFSRRVFVSNLPELKLIALLFHLE
jgi:hypothetical protein